MQPCLPIAPPPETPPPETPTASITTFDSISSSIESNSISPNLNVVLLQLYELSKSQPIYVSHPNGKTSHLQFIGSTANPRVYADAGGEQKIDQILKTMSNEKLSDTTNEPVVARYVSDSLRRIYPRSFRQSDNDIVIPRLDKYSTAALIEYCNITHSTVYDKLNRFYRQQYDTDLLCPKRELATLKDSLPTPTFDTARRKGEINEKDTLVPYVSSEITSLCKKEIERHL